MKRLLFIVPLLFLSVLFCASCSRTSVSFSTSGRHLAEAVSSDVLGRMSSIIIRFKEPPSQSSADVLARAVNITPAVSGEWSFADDRTIMFSPSEPYRGGAHMQVSVDTGVLNGGDTAGHEGFCADFIVENASFDCNPEGLSIADDSNTYVFSGSIKTDIPVEQSIIQKTLSAQIETQDAAHKQTILFTASSDPTVWYFSVDNITRSTEPSSFILSWDGAAAGVAGGACSGKKTWLVPQNDVFEVLDIAAVSPSEIRVRFSDSIDTSQDVRGLIHVDDTDIHRFTYTINGNVVSLYSADDMQSGSNVTVQNGIKSANGRVLKIPVKSQVDYDWEKPSVTFANNSGVILPTTQGVIIPIETVNLTGVIISAHQIYADNILQFLQVNELDESYEMSRVAEPLWIKSFDFEWDDSMKNRSVARGLDVSELVKKYPAGMIQLSVTFRKRHVMYECHNHHDDFSSLKMPADDFGMVVTKNSYWDSWGDDYYQYRTYRNDPCHPAFYLQQFNRNAVAKRNILVSDIGISAKKDASGSWFIMTTDMRSAQPLAGAHVTLYSFTQQPIKRVETGADGCIKIAGAEHASFITAEKNNQTSYLKIGSGTGLSMSHFEVDGEKPDNGIKGALYGERGVWRPGDDIHLIFILQNKETPLPSDFPVTFELQNPNGSVVASSVVTNSIDGFYRIDTRTASDAPTGTWTAHVTAGGRTWSKPLKIETIVPNRLSIQLQSNDAYFLYGTNELTLKSAWLHGAPAPGLKADITASYVNASTTFAGYEGYTFTSPDREVNISQERIWEGELDYNSQADVTLDLTPGKNTLPGKVKLNLVTRVFENEGTCSTEVSSWDFSPYDHYVGLKLPKGDAERDMLLTDTRHTADIVLLTPDGKRVSDETTITYALYKIDWKWWWEKDARTNASYNADRSVVLDSQGSVKTKNGAASFTFKVKYPEWGRYLIVARDEAGGHEAAQILYIDWPGWAGRSQEGQSGSAAMLTLQTDKKTYTSGATAVVSFASSQNSTALVTVEKSGVVIKQDVIKTAKGTTIYRLPLTADMAPNIYVHVSLMQPHMQTANSLPIRLYGVIPVSVFDPGTKLQPSITMSETLAPLQDATIRVKEQNGRPMTCTIAVVDEGLLGLTRFSVKNPWDDFYRKEASLLENWDIYKYVMSAYGGKLETLLSIGGSDLLIANAGKKPNRFKPVVRFFGPFTLAANETKSITFTMPQYIGAVRAMVMAGHDGAYGSAQKTATVKCDLMVQPSLPRTIGTHESIEIPVSIFSGKTESVPVTVTFKSTGALTDTQTKVVQSKGMEESTARFTVSSDKPGWSHMMFTVDDGHGAKSESAVDIETICRGSPASETKLFSIEPGKKYTSFMPSPGESGTKKLFVELSSMTVLDLTNRLDYLLNYPHGCIEQITSGGFPQLYLSSFTELTPQQIETAKKNIESVFERYPQYQTSSGGFAYWPGNVDVNSWGTCYAGHFMVEAKKAGYRVPEHVYKAWLNYQINAAHMWNPSGDAENAVQAYRLYTLACAGAPDIASMNRLKSCSMESSAEWLLAAAFCITGNQKTAAELVAKKPAESSSSRSTGGTWSSARRDKALIVYTLGLMDEPRMMMEARNLVQDFSSSTWYNTQETSWTLMALAPYYAKHTAGDNGSCVIETDKETHKADVKKLFQKEFSCFDSPTQTVTVTNTGNTVLYGKITAKGILAPGKETGIQHKLKLSVIYKDAAGDELNDSRITAMKPGETFTMAITVENTSYTEVKNAVLAIPVPTHWEFTNHRFSHGENAAAATYQDFRDTVIYTYFDIERGSSKTFSFDGYVAFKGLCAVPAYSVEAMYDSEFMSVIPGIMADNRH